MEEFSCRHMVASGVHALVVHLAALGIQGLVFGIIVGDGGVILGLASGCSLMTYIHIGIGQLLAIASTILYETILRW